jgi:hyperosmotically inducible periplasmic protein
MKRVLHALLALVFAAGLMGSAFASSLPTDSQILQQRLNGEVHHALAMIPQYTVFDDLSYSINGGTVTLYGQVRNAIIKEEAQDSVKRLEGVEHVVNNIEILPASFNDDRIRRQVARAVFNDPRLSMYAIQPIPPIHIIVKNGHVDLTGVVRTQAEKDSAFIRANGVPGVFSVENSLQVEQQKHS